MEVKKVKAKVVMSSSGKKLSDNHKDMVTNNGSLFTNGKVIGKYEDTDEYLIQQHLCFITNEEIKEGDLFIENNNLKKIHKCYGETFGVSYRSYLIYNKEKEFGVSKSICKKIVATTDKSLKVIDYDRNNGGKYQETKYKALPQPSKAFIKKYVEAGGIDEVMIDYYFEEEIHNPNPKYDTCKLKVNSHNEIIIHPVKESWSRKEVEELCRDAYITGYNTCAYHETNQGKDISEDKWVKKNL